MVIHEETYEEGPTQSGMSSASRNKKSRGKAMILRNFMGVVLHPEIHRFAAAKTEKQVKQQSQNNGKGANDEEQEDILQQAKEAVLKQAEDLHGQPVTVEPDVSSPSSLQAPVISSIVEAHNNRNNLGSSGSGESATLKIRNHVTNRLRSDDSNSGTLSTSIDVRQPDSTNTRGNARIVVRDDSSIQAKDESEETIIKLLLSDVWSGNEQIVECSLKLINVCLERDPLAARAMVPVGGHTVMLGIMKKWSSSAKIQAHACHFLGKCCSAPNNTAFADAALKYGALVKINKAFIKFPKYLMVQTAACQALEQMLLVCTDHMAIVESINVALVVAAMQTFTVNAPLQKAGSGILQHLTATRDPVFVRTIITTGGLEVLGSAYHQFCDPVDNDHLVIRERCRATIPHLITDPAAKKSAPCLFYPASTPANAGCLSCFRWKHALREDTTLRAVYGVFTWKK